VISRLRALSRVAFLAAALAVLGFGAAGYGVFGAVPATSAILETTSQSPVEIVAPPSPGVAPTGPATASRPYDMRPLIAVLALGGVGATVFVIRRHRAAAA
jgi:hypothetical protein